MNRRELFPMLLGLVAAPVALPALADELAKPVDLSKTKQQSILTNDGLNELIKLYSSNSAARIDSIRFGSTACSVFASDTDCVDHSFTAYVGVYGTSANLYDRCGNPVGELTLLQDRFEIMLNDLAGDFEIGNLALMMGDKAVFRLGLNKAAQKFASDKSRGTTGNRVYFCIQYGVTTE